MSPLNPRTLEHTPQAKIANRLADYERRLRILERGQGAHAPQKAFDEVILSGVAGIAGPQVQVNITSSATLVCAYVSMQMWQDTTAAAPLALIYDADSSSLITTVIDANAITTVNAWFPVASDADLANTATHVGSFQVLGSGDDFGVGLNSFEVQTTNIGSGTAQVKEQRLWVVTF